MTVKEMYQKALTLLGYVGSDSISGETEFARKGVAVINQIYSDLHYAISREDFIPVNSFTDKINLSARILNDVMPYGVAMLLAQSEGDGDNQMVFAALYNKKRVGVAKISQVKFTEPIESGDE